LYHQSKTWENANEAQREDIMADGPCPKKFVFHLNECLDTRLTKQEQRLVTILELIQVEKYVPKSAVTQWMVRNPLDRQAIVRALWQRQCIGFPKPATCTGRFWLP